MDQSKKGHNFAIQGPAKKISVCLYFVLMLHIKLQVRSSSGSLVLQQQHCYIGIVEKRGITQYFREFAQKVIRLSKH